MGTTLSDDGAAPRAPAAAVLLGLAGLTFLGLLVRLWDLDASGVSFDEAYHVALVRVPTLSAMLDAILSNPPSAPGYALVLRGWAALAGESDMAVRLPSILAGTLTVPAAAWLGLELTRHRGVALGAAALVCIAPYLAEHARDATYYATATLVLTAALALAFRWRRTGRRRDAVAYLVAAVAAALTSYVAVGVMLLLALLGCLRWAGPRRPTARAWLVVHAAIGLAWAPWGVGLALHWAAASAPRTGLAGAPTVAEVLNAVAGYVAGTGAIVRGERGLLTLAGIAAVVALMLGWRAGRPRRRRGLRVVVVIATLVFVVPLAAAAVTGRWLWVPHTLLSLLPALAVVAASGAVLGLPARLVRRGPAMALVPMAAVLGAIMAIGIAGSLAEHERRLQGDDDGGLRRMIALIDEDASAPVLVTPPILVPLITRYRDGPVVGIPVPFDLRDLYGPFVRPPSDVVLRTATATAMGDAPVLWLLHRPELDPRGLVRSVLERRYILSSTLTTELGVLERYERR